MSNRIVEVKRRLDGSESRFECEPIAVAAGRRAVIRYVLDRAWEVPGVTLRPGMETYGHFWIDRNYNAYHWLDGGRTVGVYLNIGTCDEITPARVVWTDYVVDVLVTPDGHVRVLDEEELDERAPVSVRETVATSLAHLVGSRERIVAEIEAETDRLRR